MACLGQKALLQCVSMRVLRGNSVGLGGPWNSYRTRRVTTHVGTCYTASSPAPTFWLTVACSLEDPLRSLAKASRSAWPGSMPTASHSPSSVPSTCCASASLYTCRHVGSHHLLYEPNKQQATEALYTWASSGRACKLDMVHSLLHPS